MQEVGRADHNHVELVHRQHLPVINEVMRNAELFCERFGVALRRGSHRKQFGIGTAVK